MNDSSIVPALTIRIPMPSGAVIPAPSKAPVTVRSIAASADPPQGDQ